MSDNLKALYQVWHKEPQGYVHALTVHSKDLATALILPMVTPRNDGVSELVANTRSTTFGDVIVSPNHDAYEVASTKHGITFDAIDFPPAQMAKLAAEQREEFQMGQQEAEKGQFRDCVRMLAEIMNSPSAPPERAGQHEREVER